MAVILAKRLMARKNVLRLAIVFPAIPGVWSPTRTEPQFLGINFRVGGDSGARWKCRDCTKLNEVAVGTIIADRPPGGRLVTGVPYRDPISVPGLGHCTNDQRRALFFPFEL
jgi:hypothetical protein